jgi:protein-disulfide isomerase
MIGRGFAAAVAAAVAFSPAASPAKPARTDWSRTVAATPEYGFRMGNPAAKIKLVEYGSLTCPHCRHFEETGFKPLVDKYVRTGIVSYEFRNLLLDTPDIAVSLLAHCAGPGRFFPMAQLVYATQPSWHEKLASLGSDQTAEIAKLPITEQTARYATVASFPQMAARFGLTPAQSRRCLADPAGIDRLITGTRKAADMGVTGTPTFFINGKKVDALTWEELEPQIRRAGGGG